jgi:hypothetical protein
MKKAFSIFVFFGVIFILSAVLPSIPVGPMLLGALWAVVWVFLPSPFGARAISL